MGERLTITIPIFLTDKPHTKTAIALPELVRQTNAFSKKYRPGCSPKLLDSNPKALFLHYNVKCNKEDSDPAGHDVRVQFDVTKVQESQKAKDLDIQVSCSCPAFLYWGAQWNLHQRDGLLGTPRPKLVAPTERLDLRANFVICKHIHAVFERILPSVQHNIVNLLRKREVEENKDKVRRTPERLKKLQDEIRKKKQMEKILKVKDKKIQQKMLDALKSEEQARLMHEQQLENQGKAPGEVEREGPAMEPEEVEVAEQVPAQALPENEDDLSAIQDLVKQEEGKIEEAHEKGLPHIHKGLPYDIEPEDEEDNVIHKFESLLPTHRYAMHIEDIKPRMRVVYIPSMSKRKLTGRVQKINDDQTVTVRWDEGHESTVLAWTLGSQEPQRRLFAAKAEELAPGDTVWWDVNPEYVGEVLEVRLNKKEPQRSIVKVDWGSSNVCDVYVDRLHTSQRRLFAATPAEIAEGDTVWFDASPDKFGKVLEVRLNKKEPQKSIVKVDWNPFAGIVECTIDRLRTGQRGLF